MVGFIQKVLLNLVESKAGSEGLRLLQERTGLPADHIFRINQSYPDEQWSRLFNNALEILKVDADTAYKLYAEYFFADATRRFPRWFEMAKNSKEFLEIQTTIHNTFASGVAGFQDRQAVNDKFWIEMKSDHEIITHYRSPNQLCGLYRALAHWMARYYHDQIEIQESCCQLRGDPECELHVRWTQLAGKRL